MTSSAETPCIRGCQSHLAACPDYGKRRGECRGCAPRMAPAGSRWCTRCFGRARRNLDSAPDLLDTLRTRADPSKAQVYDKVIVGGSLRDLTPGPVAAEIVDASEQIMRGLVAWARFSATGEHAIGDFVLAPGASAQAASWEARLAVDVILAHLSSIASDARQAEALGHFLLDQHFDDGDRDHDDRGWTLAHALQRWPLEDHAWWAAQPCQMCQLRAVRVTPPRMDRGVTTYDCRNPACSWSADDAKRGGIPWWEFFSPVTSAAPIVQFDLDEDERVA